MRISMAESGGGRDAGVMDRLSARVETPWPIGLRRAVEMRMGLQKMRKVRTLEAWRL